MKTPTAPHPYILGRQVELIYRNQKIGQIVSLAVASYMAWIGYVEGISPLGMLLWWAAAIGIGSLRLVMARIYAALPEAEKTANVALWHRRVRQGALGSGLVWAAGTALMISSGDMILQLFTAFIMAGMTAGALPVLGADRFSYRMYAWPIIFTVIIGVLGPGHMHIAFSILSFCALVIFTRSADIFNGMLDETFHMELEKIELLATVDHAREVAEQSDRAKTQFLANVSHELRTPINGIMGLAELLRQESLTTDQRALLTPLQENVFDLSRQIENLIELSRLEAGHVHVNPIPFAVGELLEGLLSSQFKVAQDKQITLSVDTDPYLPAVLIGDLERLRKVFDHLVGNAIKFTDTGSVRITAVLVDSSQNEAKIQFAIIDTGPGIAPEKLQLITGLFTKGDTSLIRRHAGIGIGLPIARKLLALMGGELRIDSVVGEGSCFSFILPFEVPVEQMLS